MPIPAVLGIPLLASVIGSAISALVTFFGKWFTRRVAIVLAAITAVVAATAAFLTLISGLLASIFYAAPDVAGIYIFLPSNFTACMSVIVTGKIAHWAYGWNVRIIQWKLF